MLVSQTKPPSQVLRPFTHIPTQGTHTRTNNGLLLLPLTPTSPSASPPLNSLVKPGSGPHTHACYQLPIHRARQETHLEDFKQF